MPYQMKIDPGLHDLLDLIERAEAKCALLPRIPYLHSMFLPPPELASNPNLPYPPPRRISNTITIMFAAITGSFRYWTAWSSPTAWVLRGDGSMPTLLTSSSPYLARKRFLCSTSIELVNSSPALKRFHKLNPIVKLVQGVACLRRLPPSQ
mmetsp:Transcript_26330/g.59004  ORF Transcript_26330/g.59004 Transcript_26330/m.59004 type:complete len:151 (-) Transcript_26330:27-479(-)